MAIERAIDPNQDLNFEDHVDIISISLGFHGINYGNPDDIISLAVDNAVDNGVIVVVCAGNSGPIGGNTYCRNGGDGSSNSIIQ